MVSLSDLAPHDTWTKMHIQTMISKQFCHTVKKNCWLTLFSMLQPRKQPHMMFRTMSDTAFCAMAPLSMPGYRVWHQRFPRLATETHSQSVPCQGSPRLAMASLKYVSKCVIKLTSNVSQMRLRMWAWHGYNYRPVLPNVSNCWALWRPYGYERFWKVPFPKKNRAAAPGIWKVGWVFSHVARIDFQIIHGCYT